MVELTGYQRDILWVVEGVSEPDIRRVKKELDQFYDYEVETDRLRENLEMLADSDLINQTQGDASSLIHEIIPSGHEFLKERLKWEQSNFEES